MTTFDTKPSPRGAETEIPADVMEAAIDAWPVHPEDPLSSDAALKAMCRAIMVERERCAVDAEAAGREVIQRSYVLLGPAGVIRACLKPSAPPPKEPKMTDKPEPVGYINDSFHAALLEHKGKSYWHGQHVCGKPFIGSHPIYSASTVEALKRDLADMTGDRDSWHAQADDRMGAYVSLAAERDALLSRVESIDLLREALARMENCCEQLAATRSHEIYTAMIDGGQAQSLLDLDNARRNARAALKETTDAK